MSENPPKAQYTSLSTIKHGGRSEQLLLKREDPNQFLDLHETYMQEFDPQSKFLQELLDQAVRMHWFFLRAQHNLGVTEAGLPEDPREWNADHHHQLALFMRYQTAAERGYHRALARLRSYHKDQLKAQSQPPKVAKERKESKPAETEPEVIEQWIEVRITPNGVVTEFYPSNDELEQLIENCVPKPELVYRRLSFPDGVPALYQWTRPRTGQAVNGGLAIQRMTLDIWRGLRDQERASGHAESTGQPTLLDQRDGEPS